MSRLLSELLGAGEPLFSISVQQLEQASGQESRDVSLSAEIVGKVNHKTRAIGLDPKDTNGPELYHGLLDMVRLHDDFLVRLVGGVNSGDVADLLPRIVSVAQKVKMPRQIWAIKHSVGKRLLKNQPPKKLMKALGYRSLESLLKRESIGEIFAALRFAESAEWLERFVQQYRKLGPSDFEARPVEILLLDNKKWEKASADFVRSHHHNVTHSKEMGVIVVLPLPVERLPGITITVLPLLLHYINELRVYSAYFKLQQVNSNFGSIVADTILYDQAHQSQMAGQRLHWRTVHKHYGKLGRQFHPELFEPHVQVEDLEWRSAEEVLYHLEPALEFWNNLDYVGIVKDGQRISFNLMDMAVNYINQMPYSKQVAYHLESSLWNELFTRYMGHQALESQVLKQLDNEMSHSDLVRIGTV